MYTVAPVKVVARPSTNRLAGVLGNYELVDSRMMTGILLLVTSGPQPDMEQCSTPARMLRFLFLVLILFFSVFDTEINKI